MNDKMPEVAKYRVRLTFCSVLQRTALEALVTLVWMSIQGRKSCSVEGCKAQRQRVERNHWQTNAGSRRIVPRLIRGSLKRSQENIPGRLSVEQQNTATN